MGGDSSIVATMLACNEQAENRRTSSNLVFIFYSIASGAWLAGFEIWFNAQQQSSQEWWL